MDSARFKRVASSVVMISLWLAACGLTSQAANDADAENLEGRWELVSADLDTSTGPPATAINSTRYVVIGPDHISGVLGCGPLAATYEYSPPRLRLTERFEYIRGQGKEDSPCDVDMWNGILDSELSVTLPEDGVMVWTSGGTQLVFEASD
jgi:hypothetical protein